MKNTVNKLVEGLERLGCMARNIRKNGDSVSELELDVLTEELRELYRLAVNVEILQLAETEAETEAGEEFAEEADAREAEEIAARKAAEEAAAKKAAEETAAKKAAEEAAAQKAADEIARKAAEEVAARKAAEEAAAKRAAEEAAAKKAAAEAAARKAAEEAARKAAESDQPLFAPEEQKKEDTKAMPPMMENIEGHANDTLFADQPTTENSRAGKTKVAGAGMNGSLFSYLGDNKEEKPTVRTLADTLNHSGRNVEEQLERKVNAKKIDDLRTIININDKFSFMSELFNNNMKAYNDFIVRLNGYVDRAQALAYVKEVAAQYGWNNESMVVKGFYKIFDRKF